MAQLREDVEAFCLARDGLRDELPGNARECDAVARETLQVVHVRRQSCWNTFSMRRCVARAVSNASTPE